MHRSPIIYLGPEEFKSHQNIFFSLLLFFSVGLSDSRTSVHLYTSYTKVVWCQNYMTYQGLITMETFVYVAPAAGEIRS